MSYDLPNLPHQNMLRFNLPDVKTFNIRLSTAVVEHRYSKIIYLQNTHKEHPYLTSEGEEWGLFYKFIIVL